MELAGRSGEMGLPVAWERGGHPAEVAGQVVLGVPVRQALEGMGSMGPTGQVAQMAPGGAGIQLQPISMLLILVQSERPGHRDLVAVAGGAAADMISFLGLMAAAMVVGEAERVGARERPA